MIRVQVLEGSWQILGVDILSGVEPREVLPTWGPKGPESLGFTLYRSPTRVHAELRPFTPVEWYPGDRVDGAPLWSGYTMQAPPGGDSGVTSVTCHGWHFYEEDRPGSALYVHDDLSAWVDGRSFLTADLSLRTAAWQVQSDGAVVLSLPVGSDAAAGASCSVILDCGPGNTARRMVLSYTSGNPPAGWHIILRSATTLFGTDESFNVATDPVAGPATFSQTFSTGRRYVEVLFSNQTGALGSGATTTWVRLESLKVFGDTAYESGGASVFTADQGIKHARNALCPLLSSDESRIATVAFGIRHSAWLREDSTMRQRVEAWNAYHGYREGVDAERRVFFQPQPSAPRLQVDASDFGVDYVATSTNDGSEVYNAVSVRGRSGSGDELRVDKTVADYGVTSLLTGRLRTRSFTLNVSAPTDVTSMEALAQAWLLAHRAVPHKANLTVSGDAVVDLAAGRSVPADELGRYYGEMIRVLSVPDPDTGALQSRDGVIASVQGYAPASLALDSERRSLEALMARMGVVQGTA
jgi:hypothetical protein